VGTAKHLAYKKKKLNREISNPWSAMIFYRNSLRFSFGNLHNSWKEENLFLAIPYS
jgi:hypothetical protein